MGGGGRHRVGVLYVPKKKQQNLIRNSTWEHCVHCICATYITVSCALCRMAAACYIQRKRWKLMWTLFDFKLTSSPLKIVLHTICLQSSKHITYKVIKLTGSNIWGQQLTQQEVLLATEGQSGLFWAQETRLKSSGTQCSFVALHVGDDWASLAPNPPPPRQSQSRRLLTRVAHASKPPKIVREARHYKHNQSVAAKKKRGGEEKANSDKSNHGGEGRWRQSRWKNSSCTGRSNTHASPELEKVHLGLTSCCGATMSHEREMK